jgi:hypothetical protein
MTEEKERGTIMSQQKAVRPEVTQTSMALQLSGPVSSASGTTLPDNSESGSLAYVIAVLTVVFTLSVGMGLRGAITLLVDALDEEMTARSQSHAQVMDYAYPGDEDYSMTMPPFTRNDTTMG